MVQCVHPAMSITNLQYLPQNGQHRAYEVAAPYPGLVRFPMVIAEGLDGHEGVVALLAFPSGLKTPSGSRELVSGHTADS